MTPPSSRGEGAFGGEFASPPKSPKQQQQQQQQQNLLPKISEDDVGEDDAKQKKASSLQQQQMTMMPQFALNSPMEAAIAPPETILKADLMEEFLTKASSDSFTTTTTEKKDEQKPVSYTHLPSPRDGLLSRMPSSA